MIGGYLQGPNWATTLSRCSASTAYMIQSEIRETWWPSGRTWMPGTPGTWENQRMEGGRAYAGRVIGPVDVPSYVDFSSSYLVGRSHTYILGR
jgi:hypothetical protein